MHILGISCFYHDSAAALLRDGSLLAAAEEERFSRVKHDSGFPVHAINFCLDRAGITPQDIDYVVFYEKPFVKFERILMSSFQTVPRSWKLFREAMVNWLLDKLWVKNRIKDHLKIENNKILFSGHHLSHAASSFFSSPFQEAAILTVDGVGEWTTTARGFGKGSDLQLQNEIRFPHSLGLFYSAFTAFLGFKVNEGEYKVMGMAPYGRPRYVEKVEKLIRVENDGGFALNMDYFCYHSSTERTFNGKFTELFGEPRTPESRFFTANTEFPSYFGEKPSDFDKQCSDNERYADIAASIQAVTEDILLKMACSLHRETGLENLCMAGGVALNSVANGRILRESPFKEIYIQPAAGDGGGALGAALYVYHSLLGNPRKDVLDHAYWGQEYPDNEIKEFLDSKGIPYQYLENDDILMERVVSWLQEGMVVGWFQGRFEWGPRALGNRSILADARRADMKDIVNTKIKFREPYRPFAPSVLAERAEDFFLLDNAADNYPARFMLLVTKVKEEMRSRIPATTHIGGTSRLQTVHREVNPRYHRLIDTFGDATGVPLVLNTSFNLKGEPIVNTPENAFNTFRASGMDALVLQRFLIKKNQLRPFSQE